MVRVVRAYPTIMERPRRESEVVGLGAARCFLEAVARDRLHTGQANIDVPQRLVSAPLAVRSKYLEVPWRA